MTVDDVVGVLTLLFCVVAVVFAKRGARRKMSEAYARGARDVSARAHAGVVVGDVIYNRGSGTTVAARNDHNNDDRTGDDDDDYRADVDQLDHVGHLSMRPAGHGFGVGELRDAGSSPAIGQLSSGSRVVASPADRGPARPGRFARVQSVKHHPGSGARHDDR